MDPGPSPLLCNDRSDLAPVLGDDSEAPAQIGQPAIIEGADFAGSDFEGGAPFDGEAFETRPLGGDHSALPFLIDGSLSTGIQPLRETRVGSLHSCTVRRRLFDHRAGDQIVLGCAGMTDLAARMTAICHHRSIAMF